MENPSPTFPFFPILGLVLFFLGSFVCQAQARAFFVFGDSLVDNGNNNFLLTTARADNYPYGIDYPTRRPTGRFSNGLNIPDLISLVCFVCFVLVALSYKSNLSKWMGVLFVFVLGEAMGSPSTLPYLSPQLRGENLLVGANFASAGIGILNDTGIQFVSFFIIYHFLQISLSKFHYIHC